MAEEIFRLVLIEVEAVSRIARSIEIERNAEDLKVADDLAVRLPLDLVDKPIHRLRHFGPVLAQPLAVALLRDCRCLFAGDVHESGHVADVAIGESASDRRDEFVGRVVGVFVVLAELVAGVALVVEEGDHERILKFKVDGVLALVAR